MILLFRFEDPYPLFSSPSITNLSNFGGKHLNAWLLYSLCWCHRTHDMISAKGLNHQAKVEIGCSLHYLFKALSIQLLLLYHIHFSLFPLNSNNTTVLVEDQHFHDDWLWTTYINYLSCMHAYVSLTKHLMQIGQSDHLLDFFFLFGEKSSQVCYNHSYLVRNLINSHSNSQFIIRVFAG